MTPFTEQLPGYGFVPMNTSVFGNGSAKLRVISISHSAVHNGAARLRYEAVLDDPRIDLTVVVPRVWHEYGKAFQADPSTTALDVRIEDVRLTRGGPASWYLHHYVNLSAVLREVQPDVIHLWEEPWSVVALQAARLRDRLLPHAALLLETDQNILRRLPPGFEQIRRFTLARTDLLIVRGNEARDVARACGYVGPTETVEYGIDRQVFFPRGRVEARQKLGINGFTLGYVGRLVPEKGLNDVLDAMHACAAPVNLLLLGEGPEQHNLQEQAARLGLLERLRFLPYSDPTSVAWMISSLDALVLMSRTTRTWKEQFGRVIMEAHACGVPVIGSSSGSIPSVVGEGGWIVPEGDSIALGQLLTRLAAMPAEELAAVGERARQVADTRFSFSIIAAALSQAWLRSAAVRTT
jgi:glycosyltransferase involved in cell wall biosynthesis